MFKKPAWATGGRTGPVRRFKNLAVFACEGLICIIDERGEAAGEATVVMPADMEFRIKELSRRYRNQTRAEQPVYRRQELDQETQGFQNIAECIKEARFMGDPSDPTVQAFWQRHRRNSKIRINLSPGSNPDGYPDLPAVDRGPFTGKTAAIDAQLPRGGKIIRQKPRRKKKTQLIEL